MAVCGGICWDASQRVYRGSRCPLALTMRCKDARAGQSSPAFHWKPLWEHWTSDDTRHQTTEGPQNRHGKVKPPVSPPVAHPSSCIL